MRCSIARKTILRWADSDQLTNDEELRTAEVHIVQCKLCHEWQEYLEVLDNSFENSEIPPFQISSALREEIRNATIQRDKQKFRSVPLMRPRLAISMAMVLTILIGGYFFISYYQSRKSRIEWINANERMYKIVKFEESASFEPNYLDLSSIPALQGTVSQQLAFLTRNLASALMEARKSSDWQLVQKALLEQELDIPLKAPNFLAISEELENILQAYENEVEIWVIQPVPTLIIFINAGEWQVIQ